MPTEEEMMADLSAADAAGDAQLAQHIAGQIKAARAPKSTEPPPFLEGVKLSLAKAANGAAFGRLPELTAALRATVTPEGGKYGDRPWRQRYEDAKKEGYALQEDADQRLAHPKLLQFAGSVGTGAALGKALTPLSAVAGSAPVQAALKGVSRYLPSFAKAAAGVGDAAGLSAASEAVKSADDPEHFKQNVTDAAEAPANLLGAAGPVLGAVLPKAGEALRKLSGARGQKLLRPTTGGVEGLRESFGSPEAAGDWLRTAKLADGTPLVARGDTPEILMHKTRMLADEIGADKTAMVKLADQVGAKPDVSDIMQRVLKAVQEMHTPGNEVFNSSALARIRRTFGKLADQSGYKGPGSVTPGAPLQTMSDWEGLKSDLQGHIHDTRSSATIQNSPLLKKMSEVSSIVKSADEEAMARAGFGPQFAEKFVDLKDAYGKAATVAPMAREAANQSVVESATGSPLMKTLAHLAAPAALGAAGGAVTHSLPAALAAVLGGAAVNKFSKANSSMLRNYDTMGSAADALAGAVPKNTAYLGAAARALALKKMETP